MGEKGFICPLKSAIKADALCICSSGLGPVLLSPPNPEPTQIYLVIPSSHLSFELGRYYYYPHFRDEKTEVQIGRTTVLSLHSKRGKE